VITAISLACFVGIAVWAYSPRNKARFEEDAQLPFKD
jgi:cytochrome c oxidase cbb3-type subunit 4